MFALWDFRLNGDFWACVANPTPLKPGNFLHGLLDFGLEFHKLLFGYKEKKIAGWPKKKGRRLAATRVAF